MASPSGAIGDLEHQGRRVRRTGHLESDVGVPPRRQSVSRSITSAANGARVNSSICWLRVASRHYADFWQVTEEALIFAGNRLGLTLPAATRSRLVEGAVRVEALARCHPGGREHEAGKPVALLSNFTPVMLDTNVEGAGLRGRFDGVVQTTDRARTYKPDPRHTSWGSMP